jgi:hypothetical protein
LGEIGGGGELQSLESESVGLVLEGGEQLLHRCHDGLHCWLDEGLADAELEEMSGAGRADEEGVVRKEEVMQRLVGRLVVGDESREDEAMSFDVVEDLEEGVQEPLSSVVVGRVDNAAPIVGHPSAEDNDVGDLVLSDISPSVDADGEWMRAAVHPGCLHHLLSKLLSENGLMPLQRTAVTDQDGSVAVGLECGNEGGSLDEVVSKAAIGEHARDRGHDQAVADRSEGGGETALTSIVVDLDLASLGFTR